MTPDFRAYLSSFAENLTVRVPEPVFGRDAEVEQVLQALASPLKGRAIVIGPTRVGKSSVLAAVAGAIARGECPPALLGREVWRFRPGNLPGLTQAHGWQEPLERFLQAWAAQPDVILLIEDLPSSAWLGLTRNGDETVNLAQALLAGLTRGTGLCLAEGNERAWLQFAEWYPAYPALFLPVRVAEPPADVARGIIERAAAALAERQRVTITAEAVDQAVHLSRRFDPARVQPGKSLDVLKDALATLTGPEPTLTAAEVIRSFAARTGLPKMLLDESEDFDEEKVAAFFRGRVLAQDQAVDSVLQMLSLLRARVNNPLRPMGVFFFLGPTGVGKTELARALADYLFGSQDRLVRFNMGDYQSPHQAQELFGFPYADDLVRRRGTFTNRIAGQTFNVIVLDEFEKAHPAIYFRFLQLFDEGLLINAADEEVNLRNSILIVTSNFGAQLVEKGQIGFAGHETPEARERRVIAETERNFTPEFINRMDAVCIFHPLTRTVMADIARREISDLFARDGLVRRNVEVDIADNVIEHVVEIGYDPHYGARYLKRQIEKTVTYPLARELNRLPRGTSGGGIRLFLKGGRVQAAYLAPQTAPAPAATTPPGAPTLAEMRAALPVLTARLEALDETFGLPEQVLERDAVLAEMTDVGFWNDAAAARRRLDAYQRASAVIDQLTELHRGLERLQQALTPTNPRADAALRAFTFLNTELPRVEFASYLSGPHDVGGAYLRVTVKSKTTGAQRWAADLARMYLGWGKSRGLTVSVLGEDLAPTGRQVTLTLALSGFGVFGLLRGEAGVHKLVQQVKLNGRDSLQRYSADVAVLPEIGEDDLPSLEGLSVATKAVSRAGLLIGRLTGQGSAHLAGGGGLTLAGDLPADELAVEATRLLRIERWLADHPRDAAEPSAPAGLVRTYTRNTREKGVHDHRTGRRSIKVGQVLAGEIQEFLDEALKSG